MDTGLDEDERLTMNRAARTARSRRLDGFRRRTVPDESHLLDNSSQQQTRPASSVSAHEMRYVRQDVVDEHLQSPDVLYGGTAAATEDKQDVLKSPETHEERNHADKIKEKVVSAVETPPTYYIKKAVIQGLMTLALLVNAYSQLKSLIVTGARHRFYYTVLSINLFSFISQIVIGFVLILILRIEISAERRRNNEKFINYLHILIIILLVAVIVLNAILSTFTVSVYDS